MKKLILATFAYLVMQSSYAQLTTAPNGGNKKAIVGERIGISDVLIEYSRPGVKGRDGKIWGELVHTGFADQGFGPSKAAPWRAGANENTTIEFSTPVKIEGKALPAGKYGLFIAYDASAPTVIFSKNSTSWGSYFYDPSEDALRVQVKSSKNDRPVEWLKYEFMNQTNNSADVVLLWENLMIPFKVEVDYIPLQLESFRKELRTDKGFRWNTWNQAANFALQNNTNLEEALEWANKSVSEPFIGEKNFVTLSTKAQILSKLNRQAAADSAMKEAMPLANVNQLHGYARQLVSQKRNKEAFDAFKKNYDQHPNEFTTNVGMMRGYSAMGNYKKALEFAQKAQPQAPDKLNKDNLEKMIGQLKEGKDVNVQ
jgi:tetratricopeptide (TPR) repeat protein